MQLTIGMLLPFIGTTLGALMVFFIKNKVKENTYKLFIGVASGVMIAASIWSLILPSIELSENQNIISWIPASLGIMIGVIFLMGLQKLIINIEKKSNKEENSKLKKTTMMIIALILHNIPEGMAVGVAFAATLIDTSGVSMAAAFTLALGIGIQNIPEGAIISLPLKLQGKSRIKAFLIGFLSGIVEPIFSVITLLSINVIVPVMPYVLAFAAGAMIYVAVYELIPECEEGKSNIGTIGFFIGFLIMMILDVALG